MVIRVILPLQVTPVPATELTQVNVLIKGRIETPLVPIGFGLRLGSGLGLYRGPAGAIFILHLKPHTARLIIMPFFCGRC